MTVVGLISDTHGLLRPEALAALEGVAHIIHAGDVGSNEILPALHEIAPVTAVRGNVDFGLWADALPAHATLNVDGFGIGVVHKQEELDVKSPLPFAAIIYGHTHKPLVESRDGILYINPGSAGPRRFKLPVTVGFLRLCSAEPPQAWIKTLEIAQ